MLELGTETLVITHDVLVEGVHVLADQDPADIAWKLVAVNLSDLAAKGAEPVGVLLGHALGDGDDRFLAGLSDVLGAYGVPLLGGDTVSAPGPRSWSMTAIGRATHVPVPSRAGARPGQALWIAGEVGAAKAAFDEITAGSGGSDAAYRRPMPMIDEGIALAPIVSAMMDCSDGVCIDAQRMANASGVTIDIAARDMPIPLHIRQKWFDTIPDLRLYQETRLGLAAANWGDDYALLFAADLDVVLPVPARRIGTITQRGPDPLLIDGRAPMAGERLGYTHG